MRLELVGHFEPLRCRFAAQQAQHRAIERHCTEPWEPFHHDEHPLAGAQARRPVESPSPDNGLGLRFAEPGMAEMDVVNGHADGF